MLSERVTMHRQHCAASRARLIYEVRSTHGDRHLIGYAKGWSDDKGRWQATDAKGRVLHEGFLKSRAAAARLVHDCI